jgi:hypothetical protein
MSTNTGYEPNSVDHRGNQQVVGLPSTFFPADAGTTEAPMEDHQMAPFPTTPTQRHSPTKEMLREEIKQSKEAMRQIEMQAEHFEARSTQQCYRVIENSQQAFRVSARKYETEAHDAAALEVAQATRSAANQHGSVMEVAERRAALRMRAAKDTITAEAEQVLHQDRSAMQEQSEANVRLMVAQLEARTNEYTQAIAAKDRLIAETTQAAIARDDFRNDEWRTAMTQQFEMTSQHKKVIETGQRLYTELQA